MAGAWLQSLAQAPSRPVALITGASAGLGALYAEQLAQAGFRLAGRCRAGWMRSGLLCADEPRGGSESTAALRLPAFRRLLG